MFDKFQYMYWHIVSEDEGYWSDFYELSEA